MNVPEEQLARQELATGPQQLDRIGLLSALVGPGQGKLLGGSIQLYARHPRIRGLAIACVEARAFSPTP